MKVISIHTLFLGLLPLASAQSRLSNILHAYYLINTDISKLAGMGSSLYQGMLAYVGLSDRH